VRAQLVDVYRRRCESDAEIAEMRGLVHYRGDMQQRFGRNAADVEADAAERRITLDQYGIHPEIGSAEAAEYPPGPRPRQGCRT